MDLKNFYDDLKKQSNQVENPEAPRIHSAGSLHTSLGVIPWRNKAAAVAQKLTDDCRKHILVDMYCKIIPLDDDYVAGNQGQMCGDIDAMLKAKNMSATQYLQSCYDQTKAPLVEFVLRSTDLIGKQFLEEENEKLKDAQEKNLDLPAPQEVDINDDDNVNNQLVDIKSDPEYQAFMDELENKTKDLIVNQVAKLITDKKDEKKMTFDPKPVADIEASMESTVSIALDYLQSRLIKEGVDAPEEIMDEMMGMAIRESTLNIIDQAFKQPYADMKSYISRIRFNEGAIVNESGYAYISEACKNVKGVIDDAKQAFKDTVDKNLKASDVINDINDAIDEGREKKEDKSDKEDDK